MKETPEAYLREVTIGDRKPHNSTIQLASYDPEWPSQFSQLADNVRQALGEKVLLLAHVGSTSIEGMPAKPVIDMVLVVADSTDEPSYVPPLEEHGFVLRLCEPDWFQHRMFKTPDIEGHLHVFSEGCEEVQRLLVFRDWLRANDDDRMLYENTKRELAARKWKYIQHYADAKTEVVEDILGRAASVDES